MALSTSANAHFCPFGPTYLSFFESPYTSSKYCNSLTARFGTSFFFMTYLGTVCEPNILDSLLWARYRFKSSFVIPKFIMVSFFTILLNMSGEGRPKRRMILSTLFVSWMSFVEPTAYTAYAGSKFSDVTIGVHLYKPVFLSLTAIKFCTLFLRTPITWSPSNINFTHGPSRNKHFNDTRFAGESGFSKTWVNPPRVPFLLIIFVVCSPCKGT